MTPYNVGRLSGHDVVTPANTLRDAAHELNNLCATILGFASLAEEVDQNSAVGAYLIEIRLAAESVATIARQLRDLSQKLETPGDRRETADRVRQEH
jgi:signal transduction histidine kinase